MIIMIVLYYIFFIDDGAYPTYGCYPVDSPLLYIAITVIARAVDTTMVTVVSLIGNFHQHMLFRKPKL